MSDLISRQDAIDAIVNGQSKVAYHDASESVLYGSAFRQNEIIDILKSLPSADTDMSDYCDRLWKIAYERGKADRPTGEWERVLYKRQGHEEVIVDGHSWRCTNCGDARKRNDIDMKYCPNCGAKMGGESE